MNRFERLLVMVPWLLKNQGISHQEVADHFNISKAQVLQDVMLLTVTGIGQFANQQFDVDYENDRIYVRDQLGLDRPFRFDSTEAACLLLGLQSLENIPQEISGVNHHEIESVRTKLIEAIPIHSGIYVVKPDLQAELDLIADSLKRGKRISFTYWNDARDDVTTRTVSPLRLYTVNQVPKLDAYDHDKGWRSFRVQNMDCIEISDLPISIETQSFEPMNLVDVEIKVPFSSIHQLENFIVAKQRTLGSDFVQALVKISEPMWLARQVLASGCKIQVVSPEDVKVKVDEYVQSARSAYPK